MTILVPVPATIGSTLTISEAIALIVNDALARDYLGLLEYADTSSPEEGAWKGLCAQIAAGKYQTLVRSGPPWMWARILPAWWEDRRGEAPPETFDDGDVVSPFAGSPILIQTGSVEEELSLNRAVAAATTESAGAAHESDTRAAPRRRIRNADSFGEELLKWFAKKHDVQSAPGDEKFTTYAAAYLVYKRERVGRTIAGFAAFKKWGGRYVKGERSLN